MKIGELTKKINEELSKENIPVADYITPIKINGYKKQNLIVPDVKKNIEKAYFEFEKEHYNLILNAYKKILLYKMRTRDAFNAALEELNAPTLFD